jgi:hypothetical protein
VLLFHSHRSHLATKRLEPEICGMLIR